MAFRVFPEKFVFCTPHTNDPKFKKFFSVYYGGAACTIFMKIGTGLSFSEIFSIVYKINAKNYFQGGPPCKSLFWEKTKSYFSQNRLHIFLPNLTHYVTVTWPTKLRVGFFRKIRFLVDPIQIYPKIEHFFLSAYLTCR